MSIAHTTPFIPADLSRLHQVIQDQDLREDLGVRPGPKSGTVVVYALQGAGSWPYECLVDDEFQAFDIVDFLTQVAAPDQEIEACENGDTIVVSLGAPAES